MYVQYDTDLATPRKHPWTVVEGDPEARYWDFRTSPEKIPEALEVFKQWAHYPAIQSFYDLLKWLNGPDSQFETNDSGMTPPRVDTQTPAMVRHVFSADPIQVHGRLSVFFRHLEWNTSKESIERMKKGIHDSLRDGIGNFPSVVMVGEWPHHFVEIDKLGHTVLVKFWAWGDDEAHAMLNLGSTFSILLQLFQHLNNQILASRKEQSRNASL